MTVSEIGMKYLRLHLTNGAGPIRAQKLLAAYGSIDRVLSCSAGELARADGIGSKTAGAIFQGLQQVDPEREAALARDHGVRIICHADKDYPRLLAYLPDPPMVLYMRGQYQPEDAVAVAIVGSRRCSAYGREQALRFANMLSQMGLTIVSGLAAGTDGYAHRGALAAGGRTIAVQGCGLARIYPPEHAELATDIQASGAVLTEYPMTMEPIGHNFPSRNRIIAGLSLGTLVIEAANRGGGLITARLANEYNREVFALPGRVDYPNAEGTNRLIRDGHATLVSHPEDVLRELGATGEALRRNIEVKPAAAPKQAEATLFPDAELSREEKAVLDALGPEAVTPDELIEPTQLPVGKVLSALTTLQLKQLVEQFPGMTFRKR